MPNATISFLIFPIYAVLLVKEAVFFSLFLLLGEIRRVMSAVTGTLISLITVEVGINVEGVQKLQNQ